MFVQQGNIKETAIKLKFELSSGYFLVENKKYRIFRLLLRKSLWHRCFPVNFVKFQKHFFLQNTSGGCFCIFKVEYTVISHRKQGKSFYMLVDAFIRDYSKHNFRSGKKQKYSILNRNFQTRS